MATVYKPLEIESLGKFLKQQIYTLGESFYSLPDEDLWAARGEKIPSKGDLPIGLSEITSLVGDVVGEAAIYAGRSYDIPMVDFSVAGRKTKAILVIDSVEWGITDISEWQMTVNSGLAILNESNIGAAKLIAARHGIDRKLHRLIIFGNPPSQFYGLFNDPDVPVIDESATTVLQLTPIEAYSWMMGIIGQFKRVAQIPYNRIVAYVEDNLYALLVSPFADITGDSPYIRLSSSERGQFLGSIQPISELSADVLQAAGVVASPKGRMILGDFTNTSSIQRHFVPIDKTPEFRKDTGIHFGITAWGGTTEPGFKRLNRFAYVDYDATIT